jgi:hypothetical protein
MEQALEAQRKRGAGKRAAAWFAANAKGRRERAQQRARPDIIGTF